MFRKRFFSIFGFFYRSSKWSDFSGIL